MKKIWRMFVCMSMLFLSTQAAAQGGAEIRFERITQEQGLSYHYVNDVIQDRRGFLWIATGNGLNRYDGYHCKVYHKEDGLSDEHVRAMYEDAHGIFWLTTEAGGLNRFDPVTEQFTHYMHDPDDPTTISDNDIRSMFVDRAGILWLGTRNAGLNRFDPVTETVTRYRHDPDDPAGIGGDYVEAIFEDAHGVLWR
ncbi:MAG: hypothetical protein GY801_52715 [bacterium]|nr:hypothetical protein [bacterium]